MKERTFISFDWAIKKVLRHKKNFTILEGFISVLLGFDITILNLLESESNQEAENDKFNRVDILVQTTQGELMLIEVQYDDQTDYFQRMVYGMSKLISEYIAEGQKYGEIKKAFSINILYFQLGQGIDYIYEYIGEFIGKNTKDILQPTLYQKKKFNIDSVADIFPKYYIIRVGNFKQESTTTPIEEWVYFLKNSDIKADFTAKGMERAKEVLKYENMDQADKLAYKRHIENVRNAMSTLSTSEEKGERRKAAAIAKKMLDANLDINLIMEMTDLSPLEISRVAQGKNINKDDE